MSALKEEKKTPKSVKTQSATAPAHRSRKEQLALEEAAYQSLKTAWERIYKEHNPREPE